MLMNGKLAHVGVASALENIEGVSRVRVTTQPSRSHLRSAVRAWCKEQTIIHRGTHIIKF